MNVNDYFFSSSNQRFFFDFCFICLFWHSIQQNLLRHIFSIVIAVWVRLHLLLLNVHATLLDRLHHALKSFLIYIQHKQIYKQTKKRRIYTLYEKSSILPSLLPTVYLISKRIQILGHNISNQYKDWLFHFKIWFWRKKFAILVVVAKGQNT